jgi:dolichyl-phosphate-mannose-protein mannosyltransferase
MPKKSLLVKFFIFVLLVVVLRFPSLSLMLDTDSSANAFFARQMLRGEILYDKFHPDHHLPGIHYTFELAFKLFGDTPTAPNLLALVLVIASTWLIYLMGRTFFDDLAGALGAFFFALGSSQIYLAGMTAEREHFANLPLIATMFLFLILLRKNAPAVQFAWIGVLGAICILYKIIFIGPLTAAGISILIGAWLERGQPGSGKKSIFRLVSIAIGLMIPLMVVAGYFASMGLWQRLMLMFTLGFTYVNDAILIEKLMFPRLFGFPLFVVAMNNIALLVFGLIGTYRLIRRAIPLHTMQNLTDFTLALWVIISFALAGMRGGGFAHYPLIVIPPLALMGGVEISLAYQRWQITSSKKHAFLGAGVMTALIVINFFWRNYDLYREYIPNTASQESGYLSSQNRQLAVIDHIKSHTTPADFIYVWSINLQPYYYADRLPPIDIIAPLYVSATGRPERIFDPRTKYIIVDDVKIFARPEWLIDGLKQNYFLEAVIDGIEIYRRKAS